MLTTPPPHTPQLELTQDDLLAVFHGLFENSLVAVLLTHPDGPVLAASPEACRMFGGDEATVCGLGRAGLADLDDPRILALAAQRARDGAARGPARMRRVGGERFEAELSSSVFAGCGGTLYSTLFVRDLEPQRRAERQVRESEERLRFALDSARIGDWEVDLRQKVSRRSLWHDRSFGHADLQADWGYARFMGHVHPDHRARVDAAYRRALAGDGDYDVEFLAIGADGRERWLWSKGRVYRDEQGEPCRVAGVHADVTARHQAERDAAEGLERLAAIIDSATDAILVADADERLLVVNPTAEEVFGCPAARALGRPLADFVELPAPLHTLRHRSGVTLRGRRADGSGFPVEASFSLGSAAGRSMMTLILRDVSQQQSLAQAREALEVAEAANRAKTDFLAHVSHELRTPLNAVIGFSDLMLQDAAAPLPPEQRRRVEHVREAGGHLLAMIRDLLDVARAEAGHLHVEPQPVALAQPLAEAVAIVQPIADTAGLTLQFAAAQVPAQPVRADPLRLRQVAVNLLGNAIKYNRPRGRIALSAAPAEGGVEIVVADTGEGMSPAQLERLFRPFERVGRERSRIEGAGLGLSLSRQLVDAMGGRLSVSSEVGVGSRFAVWLPWAGLSSSP